MKITPARRAVLWSLCSGDTLCWSDGKSEGRNNYWYLKRAKKIVDRRLAWSIHRSGLLVSTAQLNTPFGHSREFSLSESGRTIFFMEQRASLKAKKEKP